MLFDTMQFKVAVHEADCFGRLKPVAVMQYMQDLATVHAEKLGSGFHRMMEDNCVWILSKISFEILKYPNVGEILTAKTFPHVPGVVECVRDFYFYAESGELAIRASSKWCIVDIASKRIKKAQPYFPFSADEYTKECALANGCQRLDPPTFTIECFSGKVLSSDLDRNLHMNNARYGDMLFNAIPFEAIKEQDIVAVDINFLHELVHGETYRVLSEPCDNGYCAVAKKGDVPLFVGRVLMKPRESGVVY